MKTYLWILTVASIFFLACSSEKQSSEPVEKGKVTSTRVIFTEEEVPIG